MSLIQTVRYAGRGLASRLRDWLVKNRKEAPLTAARTWTLNDAQISACYRSLANRSREADAAHDRVWSDLEMEKVFARLDKSFTPLGAQYLYAMLRSGQGGEEHLAENAELRHFFGGKPEIARKLRSALKDLDCREAADLAEFLISQPRSVPSHYPVFQMFSIAALLAPFGLFLDPRFLFLMVTLWIVNLVLHWIYGRTVVQHAPALRSLARLLGSLPPLLAVIKGSPLKEVEELSARCEVAASVQRKISRVFLRTGGGGDLAMAVAEYLNMLCLFELCACCQSIAAITEHQGALTELFHIVARIDAQQGLALALATYPSLCTPEFRPGPGFTFVNVYHPLTSEPVANSIELNGKSLLLTGTNMAGKTTFMKSLGLNLMLANSLGVCFASRAILPRARLMTLINREDTLDCGQSYFFAEASELGRMLREAERGGEEVWFILDELFRGTNVIERVAAGTAVLRHAAKLGTVIASTHDLELVGLLRNEFTSSHFCETLIDGQTCFDYKLRDGPCLSRNAIKLMVTAGYPKEITRQAQALAESLEKRFSGPVPEVRIDGVECDGVEARSS